jgi:hypothetical protein
MRIIARYVPWGGAPPLHQQMRSYGAAGLERFFKKPPAPTLYAASTVAATRVGKGSLIELVRT